MNKNWKKLKLETIKELKTLKFQTLDDKRFYNEKFLDILLLQIRDNLNPLTCKMTGEDLKSLYLHLSNVTKTRIIS